MELFMLLIPAVVLPIGLSLAGIWWLMTEDDEGDADYDGSDDGFGGEGFG